jgi:outer membrane protein OmpA-like peptidoglycan-associated protein
MLMRFPYNNSKGLKVIALGLILFAVFLPAQGQLKRANRKFDRFLYSEAVPLYLKAIKKDPANQNIIERLGDTYRLINDAQNAETWFAKAVAKEGGRAENLLYYGQALMNNKKWEMAVPWLQKYVKAKADDPIGQKALKSAQNYQSFMKDSSLYSVRHLGINSPEADFGTAYNGGGAVYFASARRHDQYVFGWTGHPFLDLYVSGIQGMDLAEPKRLKGKVNSRYHEGGQTLSPDTNVMIFSRNNYIRGKVSQSKEGVIRLKTFRADLSAGKWKHVKGVPFNSNEYSVGHPALSPDGTTMYFVSDMPGGEGGTDIYAVKADLQNKTWGSPVNLGPTVNTKGNEMFPWMSRDGAFFFASNGHEGLGGLDIFEVKNFATSTEYVKNIGYPINSPRDDFAFIFDPRTGNGFFSSNRVNGTGDDDIYGFTKRKVVRGVVVDATTGEPLENARVELFEEKTFETLTRTGDKGDFSMGIDPNSPYMAVASKEGYKENKLPVISRGTASDADVVVRIPLEKINDCQANYTLAGKVHDDEGRPIPGKKVKLTVKEWIVETDEKGEIHVPLLPDQDYQVMVSEPLKRNKVYEVTTKGEPNGSIIPVDININALDSGKVFYIIYYNFDKHDIREGDARPELDRVVNFMRANPQVKVDLMSHTDCRATNEYNETLSKNRAIEAYTYITNHGVEKDRLSYSWKGETQLTNACADGVECTEVEHQRNRRTEFRINGFYYAPK